MGNFSCPPPPPSRYNFLKTFDNATLYTLLFLSPKSKFRKVFKLATIPKEMVSIYCFSVRKEKEITRNKVLL